MSRFPIGWFFFKFLPFILVGVFLFVWSPDSTEHTSPVQDFEKRGSPLVIAAVEAPSLYIYVASRSLLQLVVGFICPYFLKH